MAEQLGGLLAAKGTPADINKALVMGWYVVGAVCANVPGDYSYGILVVIGSPKPYQRLCQLFLTSQGSFYFRAISSSNTATTEIIKEWSQIQLVL